jgi:hypothetical protein
MHRWRSGWAGVAAIGAIGLMLGSHAFPAAVVRVVGVVSLIAGALLELGTLAWALRTGRIRPESPSPLWELTGTQRRALRRQVVRNAIEPGSDRAALRLTADGLRNQTWVGAVVAGLACLTLGQALLYPAPLLRFVAGVTIILLVATVALTTRQTEQAARFQRDHPS